MNEFEVIEKYFRRLTQNHVGTHGLQDDAAALSIPMAHDIVVTSDTLNAGTHFLENEHPAHIARKALRVNLSDLAAMGADPFCYQLNLAFPSAPDEYWLAEFTGALLAENANFHIFCSGGDTTSIKGGYLSISITALGLVPSGRATHRGGAKEGDVIILTGPVGDAFLGLKALREGLDYPEAIHRYRTPNPRLQSSSIRFLLHAAVDISDGLIADLGHIAKASNLQACIQLPRLIYSGEVMSALREGIVSVGDIITGGDDYELVFAAPLQNEKLILETLHKMNLHAFSIGYFNAGQGVNVLDATGQSVTFENSGWTHF